MNDRAELLKVTASIASCVALLFLIFSIIISGIDEFTIYPYLCWLLAFVNCIRLWKMYADAR